jgi:hypothetical protein
MNGPSGPANTRGRFSIPDSSVVQILPSPPEPFQTMYRRKLSGSTASAGPWVLLQAPAPTSPGIDQIGSDSFVGCQVAPEILSSPCIPRHTRRSEFWLGLAIDVVLPDGAV